MRIQDSQHVAGTPPQSPRGSRTRSRSPSPPPVSPSRQSSTTSLILAPAPTGQACSGDALGGVREPASSLAPERSHSVAPSGASVASASVISITAGAFLRKRKGLVVHQTKPPPAKRARTTATYAARGACADPDETESDENKDDDALVTERKESGLVTESGRVTVSYDAEGHPMHRELKASVPEAEIADDAEAAAAGASAGAGAGSGIASSSSRPLPAIGDIDLEGDDDGYAVSPCRSCAGSPTAVDFDLVFLDETLTTSQRNRLRAQEPLLANGRDGKEAKDAPLPSSSAASAPAAGEVSNAERDARRRKLEDRISRRSMFDRWVDQSQQDINYLFRMSRKFPTDVWRNTSAYLLYGNGIIQIENVIEGLVRYERGESKVVAGAPRLHLSMHGCVLKRAWRLLEDLPLSELPLSDVQVEIALGIEKAVELFRLAARSVDL
jgi:hypothetical protein